MATPVRSIIGRCLQVVLRSPTSQTLALGGTAMRRISTANVSDTSRIPPETKEKMRSLIIGGKAQKTVRSACGHSRAG
jgi:hypothetical protein